MFGDGRHAEVEAFEHDGDDVALVIDGDFDLFAQPVIGFVAAFQGGWGKQNDEMGAGLDAFHNDAFEFAAGDADVVEEDVEAVVMQILVDGQRPGGVGATVADEYGSFGTFHKVLFSSLIFAEYQRQHNVVQSLPDIK